MKFKHIILAGIVSLSSTTGHAGQLADTPEIAQKLHTMGNKLSREIVGGTYKIYRPITSKNSMDGIQKISDQTYGVAKRNTLDVYKPTNTKGSEPILIFAHGGGFVRGDKKDVANIGSYFSKNGIVTITFNYRFAPDNKWPSGPQDVSKVMQWIKDNAKIHGGDISKIFVAGNSAGSAHVADYALHEEFQINDDGMIGAILISPPTANLNSRKVDPKRGALYYGTDASKYQKSSYINALDGRKVPVMLALGELDLPIVHAQTAELVQSLYKRDSVLPVFSIASGHTHISIVEHIGTQDQSLGQDMLEFIKYESLGLKP